MNLPLTVSVDYFRVLFSSLLGSLYPCVHRAFRDTRGRLTSVLSCLIVTDANTKLLSYHQGLDARYNHERSLTKTVNYIS